MSLTIHPGTLRGTVRAPASKSYTHRALVAAASLGRSLAIQGPLASDDTRRTAAGLRRLGYPVGMSPGRWTVRPRGPRPSVRRPVRIDCGDSGTTLRFLTALAAREDRTVCLTGRGRLPSRPLEELLAALRSLGARVRRPRSLKGGFEIHGPIAAGTVAIRGDRSSQFVSALLLALSGLPEPSRVRVLGRPVSAPYIEATTAVLGSLGATVVATSDGWRVGGARHGPGARSLAPPGDASAAAIHWVGAAVTGGDVVVAGVDRRWPQADLAILAILRSAGSVVTTSRAGIRVRGRPSRPIRTDLDDAPDLLPLVGALAAFVPARSVITGAAHAALKESDRRSATARLCRDLGAKVRCTPQRLEVTGARPPHALPRVDSLDHRVVAASAIAALATGPSVRVAHPEAVRKSYPGLWRDLRRLGADVRRDR